jgi:hypothetical protein
MAKKPHPADQAEIDKIAAATHFAVHLRAGPFDKITKDAATLEDAIRIADAMGTTPTAGGRWSTRLRRKPRRARPGYEDRAGAQEHIGDSGAASFAAEIIFDLARCLLTAANAVFDPKECLRVHRLTGFEEALLYPIVQSCRSFDASLPVEDIGRVL